MPVLTTNYDAFLERLSADRDKQAATVKAEEEKLQAIEAAIVALSRLRGIFHIILTHPDTDHTAELLSCTEVSPSPQDAFIQDDGSDHELPLVALQVACRRKSIADAAIAVLALGTAPLDEELLLTQLERGGTIFTTEADRKVSLRQALLRKQRDTHAISEVSTGMWALSAWKETTNPNHLGFVSHRDKGAHMEASLRGLRAARDQGVKLGAPAKIPDEQAQRVAALLDSGMTIAAIAAEFGVSAGGMSKAIARLRARGLLISTNGSTPDGSEIPPDAPE